MIKYLLNLGYYYSLYMIYDILNIKYIIVFYLENIYFNILYVAYHI